MTFSVWGSFGTNTPTRDVFATETFAILRLLTPPPSTLNTSIEVDGGVAKGDGLGGIFYYDPVSVLADDNVNVIAPTPFLAAGRWIRRDIVPGYNTFRKNAIINGGMEIAQRGTNFPAIISGTYNLDRWFYAKNGTLVHTLSQDNDVPTVAQAGQLFLNSLRLSLTTPQAIIGAGDYSLIEQRIEGYNWRSLAQRPCMLSFWVKATLPGVYSISLANSGDDQVIANDFIIFNINTWEKKTIPIVASPAAGTWNYTNGIGIKFTINLAIGSNFLQNPGLWGVFNKFGSTNQINGVQAGATDFRITGVQLETGSLASEFERRSIQEELFLCQRYYEKSWNQGIAPLTAIVNTADFFPASANVANGSCVGMIQFKVVKRNIPIVVVSPYAIPTNINRVSDNTGADLVANSGVATPFSDRQCYIQNQSGGAIVPAAGGFLAHYTASAEL